MRTCYDCKLFKEFPNFSNICRKTYRENINPAFACSSIEPKNK